MKGFKFYILFIVLLLFFVLQISVLIYGDLAFTQYLNASSNRIIELTVPPRKELTEEEKLEKVVIEGWNTLGYNDFGRIGLGAYFPNLSIHSLNNVNEYELKIGHKLKYLLFFKAWGDNDNRFPTDIVSTVQSLGITPIITWEPWKRDFENFTALQSDYIYSKILSGKYDDYIRSWAREAKSAPSEIIIRFAHEQSTPPAIRSWYPWQGYPTDFKKAFRKIVGIFREESANNVTFMWNPVAFWPESTLQYYPGDLYVDYVGMTVLNHGVGNGQEDNNWKQCDFLYFDQYRVLSSINKPFIITEFGSAEEGGNKAQWIKDCINMIKVNSKVVGLVALESSSDSFFSDVNWATDTTEKSFNAFKEAISNQIFK